ncbi:E3 ubiquitin-protein ligase RNF182-like [Chiloscyllium plagiosum]|uniref:E3 ubiquitin-protein ligase RNF182-like n=1 Tax=Chiloscyllium plagiosum TaxID=36176 RepID=UPI001CB7C19D|nr:E3 ubiquitin-protein ligase RNF182-like [Chiloscyllium plagiosum]XP_043574986.1 E3 ubiquitin-protein ligase RNF182-like [Chiloscyllium plagiosum]XP_043574987.1 E3 ubiquitin-protein ligase RNF182-like [Chiloscyllium plagiosum]XP_043574988.1 E3 ubiquitin-protein ligase RNF182-like [Chiloscyllium plagiosum]
MNCQTIENSIEKQWFSSEELECKICYNPYNLKNRRPKLLECFHRVCARCLHKIVDLGDSSQSIISCPFCRYETSVLVDEVGGLPDDNNILAVLVCKEKNRKFAMDSPSELLLTPKRLSSFGSPSRSSNCLVITIMEVQRESPQSQSSASVTEFYDSNFGSIASMSQQWAIWNCTPLLCRAIGRILVWLLGLLYFSSLPLGVYLLVIQKVTLGIIFVSLVPSSLVMLMVYGFCQCLCHEFLDCISS